MVHSLPGSPLPGSVLCCPWPVPKDSCLIITSHVHGCLTQGVGSYLGSSFPPSSARAREPTRASSPRLLHNFLMASGFHGTVNCAVPQASDISTEYNSAEEARCGKGGERKAIRTQGSLSVWLCLGRAPKASRARHQPTDFRDSTALGTSSCWGWGRASSAHQHESRGGCRLNNRLFRCAQMLLYFIKHESILKL